MTGKQRLALAISTALSLAGGTGCSGLSEVKTTSGYDEYNQKIVVHHISYQKQQTSKREQNASSISKKAEIEQQLTDEINALARKLRLGKFAQQTLLRKAPKRTYPKLQIRRASYNNKKIRLEKVILRKKVITRRKATQYQPIVTRKIAQPITTEAANLSAFEREVNRLYSPEKIAVSPQQISGNSLWSRITNGYQLDADIEKTLVEKVLNQYARNPKHLNRTFARSAQYLHIVLHELNRRKMPTELVLLPMVESAYDNKTRSRTGGVGLWQLTSIKGKQLGLKQTHDYDARLDVFASTKAVLDSLQRLNKKFSGDWGLTLASYQLGEARVLHEIKKNRFRRLPTDYWHLNLPRETAEYVPQLLAYREILLRPHAYGLKLPVVNNKPKVIQIVVNKSIDLYKVARIAELPASTLTALNLNFKNGITNPSASRQVVLPRRYASQLHQAIKLAPGIITATYKAKKQSKKYTIARINKAIPKKQLIKYRVRSGDNLYKIALRHGTTVTKIMRLNGMQSTKIKAGSKLKIAIKPSATTTKYG